MEYVIVRYYRNRNVYMDGRPAGKTNQTLRVEEGTHRFDLGPNKNYAPDFHNVRVTGTSQIKPLEICFSPLQEVP